MIIRSSFRSRLSLAITAKRTFATSAVRAKLPSLLEDATRLLDNTPKPQRKAETSYHVTPDILQLQPVTAPQQVGPPILVIPPNTDPLLSYLTSHLQKHGERHKAARIVTRTLAHLHAITHSPPLPILREAILLASPSVRIITHRKSAKNTLIPMALADKQRAGMAIRWILKFSGNRSDRSVHERLAKEIVAIIKGDSEVLKKRDELHKSAMLNRYGYSQSHAPPLQHTQLFFRSNLNSRARV
jgi:small subunit ribosomal protein S7